MIRTTCDCCGEEKYCDVLCDDKLDCNIIVCLDCQKYAVESVRVPDWAVEGDKA